MNTGTGQGVDPQAGAEIEQLEKDVADKVEKLAEHGTPIIDVPKVYGEKDVVCSTRIVDVPEAAEEVNDNQHIDVARVKGWFTAFSLRDVFNQSDLGEFTAIKDMVFELCDLAQEAGFLKDVQEARQELSGEEAEKVLPSIP